ncbi:MAG TPA: AraC family transcriptional regulator [Polyangiaceae bacterium]|nr:AraC family transcriptional regulator [Polyangiaceae bacterium]
MFAELEVTASVWVGEDYWHPIHAAPTVTEFENSYVIQRRWRYNRQSFDKVARTRRTVIGEHLGFRDVFVPIDAGEAALRGVVVAGPIASTHPTSAEVIERWYALAKSKPRLGDPVFSRYLARTLATPTFAAEHFKAFLSLLSCFALMLADKGDAAELAREAGAQHRTLLDARFAERMWRVARTLLEPTTTPDWAVHEGGEMTILGLERFPGHAVVGLLSSRADKSDPVGDVLKRDVFQRACVDLARKRGNALCGQLADGGVFFLVHALGSALRVESQLAELAARASAQARRFGFKLHAGIGRGVGGASLHSCYEGALLSAERALLEGTRVGRGEPPTEGLSEHLRKLRRELGAGILEKPELIRPRFDRYVEAVMAHSAYRHDIARAELESGLERLTEPLLTSGLLDQKTIGSWFVRLERDAETANGIRDLVTSFRQVVSEIESTLQSPTITRQSWSIERAASYMREHLSDELDLQRVSRAAGFAPAHFWRLFKRERGVSFAAYLRRLRLDEARQLLQTSNLGIDQIRQLSGFRSRTNFFRAFHRATGLTPIEYRESR